MIETKRPVHIVGKILQADETRIVFINDVMLRPERSQEVHNHSPDGFSWGYSGSGPAQLALAILIEVTGNDGLSHRLHQQFKEEVIAKLGMERGFDFTMDIKQWIKEHTQ